MLGRNLILVAVAAISISGFARGKGDHKMKHDMPEMSREQMIVHHQKMAEMNSKMLECLKSEKTIDTCKAERKAMHQAMHKEMHNGEKGESCPMME